MLRKRKIEVTQDEASVVLFFEIIVPMFNEETVIIKTIECLLRIDYENFIVTIIDDGSTDSSLALVISHFADNSKIKILTQSNSGKSSALNTALKQSSSDIVICLDADTMVRPDVIKRFLPYFDDERVAAVSGYLKVGNRQNLITEIQYKEYITNQNFDRFVFESVNAIFNVPGAIGGFRRSVLVNIGGYSSETMTEDNDLTLEILNKNYIIKNAPEVIGYTEAPSNISMFFRQRVRWKVGSIQVLLKHGRHILAHPNNALVFFAIPFTWVFDVILPVFLHLIDYVFLYNIFVTNLAVEIAVLYGVFVLLDTMICFIILRKFGEKTSFAILAWQRLLLRHLLFLVYVQIVINYLKGDLFKWLEITREGTVPIK